MDPITIIATVSAAYNGVKKAVQLGREAQDIFGQLGKWAHAAGDLQEFIRKAEKKNDGVSGFITGGNDSKTAMDIIAAKSKLAEMEKEIRYMFIYGELQHLGLQGYSEFVLIRRRIREEREQEERRKILKRQQIIENTFWYTILGLTIFIAGFILYFIYAVGHSSGKW